LEVFANIMMIAGTSTSGSLLGSEWRQVSHEAWAELNDDEYEEEEEEVCPLNVFLTPLITEDPLLPVL
jgi:hypothetical protein